MRFDNKLGLVNFEDDGHTGYIPWRHVHGLFEWIVIEENPYQTYPYREFSREEVGFILAYYPEEMQS